MLSTLFLTAALVVHQAAQPNPMVEAWGKAEALKKSAAYAAARVSFDDYAKTYPSSPRAAEALVEAGVCHVFLGRAKLKLQQNTPDSDAELRSALAYFERVTKDFAASPVAGRAQYMRGTANQWLGQFKDAEAHYGLVFEKYRGDVKYAPKSLERRSAMRRATLDSAGALADLELYRQLFPAGEDLEAVRKYIGYAIQFEKPAPALDVETWIQGEPRQLTDFHGELVALFYFASWCEKCEAEMPFLLDLHERMEPMGLHMIGVMSHARNETLETARAHLAKKKIRFPVMMDRGQTTPRYLGTKLPDLVLIDRAGNVRWHDNPSALHQATLEALLIDDPSAKKPSK